MTDRDATLRPVLADPADDLPRLAFADWAEDHGDPELAEFVRLGVQLGEWEGRKGWSAVAPGSDLTAGDVFAAWGRFEELMGTAGRFLPESVRGDGRGFRKRHAPSAWTEDESIPMRVRFDRGFVDATECELAQFLEHAPALFAAHPVTSVRLTDREPADWIEQHYFWYDDRRRNGWRAGASYLPAAIYEHIDWRFDLRPGNEFSTFYSRDAAMDGLSQACVEYGRQLAGLPPLRD